MKIRYVFGQFFSALILTHTLAVSSVLANIFQMVGEIAQSEQIRPICFIMHADQAENDQVLVTQAQMVVVMQSAGLDVRYSRSGDNGGLPIGGDIQEYMRRGIKESDFIFAFYSPYFLQRSLSPTSGVSTEINILMEHFNTSDHTCFIPIILAGSPETSIPYCLRNFYAAQSTIADTPYTINMFKADLMHLLYYRIFRQSASIAQHLKPYVTPSVLTMSSTHVLPSGSLNLTNESQPTQNTMPINSIDLADSSQYVSPPLLLGNTANESQHIQSVIFPSQRISLNLPNSSQDSASSCTVIDVISMGSTQSNSQISDSESRNSLHIQAGTEIGPDGIYIVG